jgi:hypothetical protein
MASTTAITAISTGAIANVSQMFPGQLHWGVKGYRASEGLSKPLLPELTIPRRFQWQRLKEYTELVKSSGRRAFISDRIKAIRSTPSNSG